MGKDLKGKNLGEGISQRKDGKYTARFTNRLGKRVEKHFDIVSEAKKWLAEARYENEHSNIGEASQMTVNAWFDFWITEVKGKTTKANTVRNYKERYNRNVKDIIGNMVISEVRPLNCQMVLNQMLDKYKSSTINQCRITMSNMFSYAVENFIIPYNPVIKSVKCPKKDKTKVRFLTLDEQKKFLDVANGTSKFDQFAFILETGLRTGELIGLRWEDVDFKQRTINIQRSVYYKYDSAEFVVGEPKSEAGYRTIPLTQTAYNILLAKRKEAEQRKIFSLMYNDYVFLNKKGNLSKNSSYDEALYHLADKAGIKRFSMHTLRHTFATRAIEANMNPKTLQVILGHSDVSITMGLYVHVTEDEKIKQMKKFEEAICIG